MTGTNLGHYRILERLGKGGMGEVFLAEDTKLGRRVALKVLTEELTTDADWRQRFEREARAVAALNHPSIVTIHSVEEAGGVLFLTGMFIMAYNIYRTLATRQPVQALIPKPAAAH